MASVNSYDPANKGTGLALSSNVAFGSNSIATATTTSFAIGRTVTSKSSGKWICYFSSRSLGGSNQDVAANVGIVNGSATLNNRVGGDANGYGVDADGNVYFNGSSIYSFGSTWFAKGGELVAIAIDLDASPKRGWMRRIGNGGGSPNWNDSGWKNFTGSAGDPTTASSGTDISGLGTPLYFAAGQIIATNTPANLIFTGGWPAMSQSIPVPTGFAMPDTNYPYTMPAGSYTLSNNTLPGNITVSQNNMRASVVSGGASSGTAYTSNTPAGTKKMTAVYWELMNSGSNYASHVLYTSNGTIIKWSNDGSTSNLGGATWASFLAGDTTYLFYDEAGRKVWGTKDGVTFYGNGGASPNPFTGTNGADVSAVGGIGGGAGFGIYLSTDGRSSGTFNAGKLVDNTITLSGGFQWLELLANPRSRSMLMGL